MKHCPKCDRVREDQAFYPKRLPDGKVTLRSYCKECSQKERDLWRTANKAHDDARNNAYNMKHARRIRGHKLRSYWPECTWEEALVKFEELYKAQNGVCYLCSQLDKRVHPVTGTRWQLAVDHDHNTGIVRGLLCNAHNRALGLFNHDIDLLQKAIEYLNKGAKDEKQSA